jgi:hypothetical protein
MAIFPAEIFWNGRAAPLVGCAAGVFDARASRQNNPNGEEYGEYGARPNRDPL